MQSAPVRISKNNLKDLGFSIILPTYNRINLLPKAINSVLGQTYKNFELIVIDDGSKDGTKDFIAKNYASYLASGKIKYIYKKNSGVCRTRNMGLKVTQYPWIAYIDSDNEVTPDFLETFSTAIQQNPKIKLFYAKAIALSNEKEIGRKFNYNKLLRSNFIDMGTFVHHRSLYENFGGFDENMTSIEDWELILRYVKHEHIKFIDKIVLLYNDFNDHERITTTVDAQKNLEYLYNKHKTRKNSLRNIFYLREGKNREYRFFWLPMIRIQKDTDAKNILIFNCIKFVLKAKN